MIPRKIETPIKWLNKLAISTETGKISAGNQV